jgi:hypothetical protein
LKTAVTKFITKQLHLQNPTVHHRIHKSSTLNPILSEMSSILAITFYLSIPTFNIILVPTPGCSEMFDASKFFDQHFVCISHSPKVCHMSYPHQKTYI